MDEDHENQDHDHDKEDCQQLRPKEKTRKTMIKIATMSKRITNNCTKKEREQGPQRSRSQRRKMLVTTFLKKEKKTEDKIHI